MTQTTKAATGRRAAVYRLYDEAGALLYIGSAYDPTERCKAHREKPWWPQVARRTEEWFGHRNAAFTAESAAIRKEAPMFNQIQAPEPGKEVSRRRKDTREERRLKCKVAAEALKIRHRVTRQLKAEGHSEGRANVEGLIAERAFKEESGAFPDGVNYPPLEWIEARLAKLAE